MVWGWPGLIFHLVLADSLTRLLHGMCPCLSLTSLYLTRSQALDLLRATYLVRRATDITGIPGARNLSSSVRARA